jgi:hypothetical protein
VFVRFCQKYLRPEEIPHIERTAQMPVLKELVKNPRKTLKRVGVKLNTAVPRRTP